MKPAKIYSAALMIMQSKAIEKELLIESIVNNAHDYDENTMNELVNHILELSTWEKAITRARRMVQLAKVSPNQSQSPRHPAREELYPSANTESTEAPKASASLNSKIPISAFEKEEETAASHPPGSVGEAMNSAMVEAKEKLLAHPNRSTKVNRDTPRKRKR